MPTKKIELGTTPPPGMIAATVELGNQPPAGMIPVSEKQASAPLTLAQRAESVYGFDPDLERAALLPIARNPEGELEFAFPQIAVDVAKSALLPGHVWQGGSYTQEDVARMALDVGAMPARSVATPGRLTKRQFIEQAPTRDTLKAQSQGAYADIKAKGIVVPGANSKQLVANLGARFREEGADSVLHPKAVGMLEKWALKTQDGADMSFGDLEIMRRQAGMVAKSLDPSEARLGAIMKGEIDDYMDRLPDAAGIKKARSLWRRNAKLQDIEEIFFKAENSASGFENGLRTGFRALLNNKRLRRNYTKAEITAMRRVINGGPWRAFLRTMRHLGPGTGSENRFLGTLLGSGSGAGAGAALGGPVGGTIGAIATPVAGHLAGRAAQRQTTSAAELARAIIASGGRPLDSRTAARILGRHLVGPALGTQIETEAESN